MRQETQRANSRARLISLVRTHEDLICVQAEWRLALETKGWTA